MRSIEQISVGPDTLVGTSHLPAPAERRRIGVLFLNAGYVPRDGHAGLSAKLGDALVALGFPAFRFDLPMLGDSPGELPAAAEQLYDMVYRGDFAATAIAIARELCRRHALDGLVLGGLCGGAITAIYAADRERSSIVGLALFEPEMYRSNERTAPAAPGARKLFSYWGWMRALTRENRLGRYIPLPRELLLGLLLQRGKLPGATNVPLVAAWRRVVERRLPTLVMTAQGKLHEVFFDRINAVALAGAPTSHITRVSLPRTNHTFTTGGAIDEVKRYAVAWTARTFDRAPAALA